MLKPWSKAYNSWDDHRSSREATAFFFFLFGNILCTWVLLSAAVRIISSGRGQVYLQRFMTGECVAENKWLLNGISRPSLPSLKDYHRMGCRDSVRARGSDRRSFNTAFQARHWCTHELRAALVTFTRLGHEYYLWIKKDLTNPLLPLRY